MTMQNEPQKDITFSTSVGQILLLGAVISFECRDRPRCPWCGEPMWLVRVLETGPQLSERRFECATCEMGDVRVEPA